MTRIMSLFFRLVALIIIAAFISCKGDLNETAEIQGSDDIKITGVSVTAFTASVTGTFKGLDKVDIALGRNGVLYCKKSDNADAIFKSWQDGNTPPECKVYENRNGFDGESFSGTVKGLYPETEYSFCLFSQGQDGHRKISSASSCTTAKFTAEIKTVGITKLLYYESSVSGSISMDSKDATCCKYGIAVTGALDGEDSSIKYYWTGDEYSEVFDVKVKTTPDMEYSYYAFIEYTDRDGKNVEKKGETLGFRAKNLEQMAVDLDLPSGIKWAECDLGEQEFQNLRPTKGYAWGCTISVHGTEHSFLNDNEYQWWDSDKKQIIDIGNEISGTQYDAAHVILGGKWRMPTADDFTELVNQCDVSLKTGEKNDYNYNTRTVTFTGKNGNIIRFAKCNYTRDGWWTSTLEVATKPDGPVVGNPYYFDLPQNQQAVNNIRNHYLSLHGQKMENPIRPVWDPNM